jgi:hypothetical protein
MGMAEFEGSTVTCPKCGEMGTLVTRGRTHTKNRYWQVRHDQYEYCYVGLVLPSSIIIEIRTGEKPMPKAIVADRVVTPAKRILSQATEQRKETKQTELTAWKDKENCAV